MFVGQLSVCCCRYEAVVFVGQLRVCCCRYEAVEFVGQLRVCWCRYEAVEFWSVTCLMASARLPPGCRKVRSLTTTSLCGSISIGVGISLHLLVEAFLIKAFDEGVDLVHLGVCEQASRRPSIPL